MSQSEFTLSTQLKVGPVCLKTNNLDQMLSFYEDDFGLKILRRDGELTTLGTHTQSEPLIILHHDAKAVKPPRTATGLYHFALLVPDRESLASAYVSLGGKGVIFNGYSDHQVSEALYLNDPEGNGIEIYSDRPKDKWSYDEGEVQMGTQPLDLDSLIKELPAGSKSPQSAIAAGTKVGHIHLKVSDLQSSLVFYRDGLGLELTRYFGSAAFLSAGGYHHHIGINTWESLGGEAASKADIGMEYFTLIVPEHDLNQLAERLGTSPVEGEGSKRLFVSDPDNLSIVFRGG